MGYLLLALLIFGAVFITGIVETAQENTAVGIILMVFSGILILILVLALSVNMKSNSEKIEEEKEIGKHILVDPGEIPDIDLSKLNRFERGCYYLSIHDLDKAIVEFNIGRVTDVRCKKIITEYDFCKYRDKNMIIAYLMDYIYMSGFIEK